VQGVKETLRFNIARNQERSNPGICVLLQDKVNVFKTLEYYRGSGRPGSNEVTHVKLR